MRCVYGCVDPELQATTSATGLSGCTRPSWMTGCRCMRSPSGYPRAYNRTGPKRSLYAAARRRAQPYCRRADVRGTAIIDLAAVKVGGIHVSALGTRAANEACRELHAVNGKVDFAGYVVDLCFMTYEQGG